MLTRRRARKGWDDVDNPTKGENHGIADAGSSKEGIHSWDLGLGESRSGSRSGQEEDGLSWDGKGRIGSRGCKVDGKEVRRCVRGRRNGE